MAKTKQVTWTTHKAGAYVIHADERWNNGNSPTGLALAVRQHERGGTSDHVVHAAGHACGHCPAGA
jgi:hypothetical protein